MDQPKNLSGIRAVTFDVFGTLLAASPEPAWFARYAEEVRAVRAGRRPYRSLTQVFGEIGADPTELQPRPGLVDALLAISRRHMIAPLSNADSLMARRIADHFRLPWNRVIDTETATAFKPDPRVYKLALMRLGVAPRQLLHVASHKFDLAAAAGHGIRTAYLAWPGYADPCDPDEFDLTVPDLAALAAALGCPVA